MKGKIEQAHGARTFFSASGARNEKSYYVRKMREPIFQGIIVSWLPYIPNKTKMFAAHGF